MSISVTTIICDDARREDSGKMILIGVYNDSILFPLDEWEAGRTTIQSIIFVNFITAVDEEEKTVKWWIKDPEGKIWGAKKREEGEMKFGGGTATLQIKVAPATFTESGFYEFKLNIGARRHKKRFFVGSTEDYRTAIGG